MSEPLLKRAIPGQRLPRLDDAAIVCVIDDDEDVRKALERLLRSIGEELLKKRPSEIEARLKLKQKLKKPFEARVLGEMCGKIFPLELLREPDGVRQLQELAFEEDARGVTEAERADSAAHVYESACL